MRMDDPVVDQRISSVAWWNVQSLQRCSLQKRNCAMIGAYVELRREAHKVSASHFDCHCLDPVETTVAKSAASKLTDQINSLLMQG
jgi:hypothetical protein